MAGRAGPGAAGRTRRRAAGFSEVAELDRMSTVFLPIAYIQGHKRRDDPQA
ncbi:hypothetical protein WME79_04730 [Sorangium sp. So ce726]|uniref:hypothetical protein n=1 Tax=Sorangium sp. So ce726 TaxID=3133319 RepID=UPI003F604149